MSNPEDRPASDVAQRDVATWAAAMLDIDLPRECLPGVADNLAALATHAGRLVDPDDPA